MLLTALESIFAGARTLADRFAACQACGFDGIDLREGAGEVALARQLGERYGLKVGMIYSALPIPLLSETAVLRAAALDLLRKRIEQANRVGAFGVVVVPVFGPPRIRSHAVTDVREAEEILLEVLLTEMEPWLSGDGAYLAIEPLNHEETHLFTSPLQAMNWLAGCRLTGVKTMADVYHMEREGQDILQEVSGVGDYLGCIHVAGPERGLPRLETTDYPGLFRQLTKQCYSGPVGYECRPHPVDDIRQNVHDLKRYLP